MSLLLSKDVWRIIGKELSKKDLISLQIAYPELGKVFDRIPEVWHWKHLDYYWENYKSNKLLKEDIFCMFMFSPYMIFISVPAREYRFYTGPDDLSRDDYCDYK